MTESSGKNNEGSIFDNSGNKSIKKVKNSSSRTILGVKSFNIN